MTPGGASSAALRRRYLVVRAGTYAAPSLPRAGAAVVEPAADGAALAEDSQSLAADLPDFGLSGAFQTTSTPRDEAPAAATPEDAAPVLDAPRAAETPSRRHPSPRDARAGAADRRVWARRSARRMLIGAAVGAAVGILVGLFMLWVFRGGAPWMALSDPVLLWRGADQYRQLAAVLVTVGFAILGAARGIRSSGEFDSRLG